MFVKHAKYDPRDCFVYIENNTCRIVFNNTDTEVKCQYDHNNQVMTILITIGNSTMTTHVHFKSNIIDIGEIPFKKFENYYTIDDVFILNVKNDEKGTLSIGYGIKNSNEFILNAGYITDKSVVTGFFTFDISSDNS